MDQYLQEVFFNEITIKQSPRDTPLDYKNSPFDLK